MAAIYEEYDTIADALFAAKLQQEDREQYTIKERAKFLAETIAAQRKFRATQRAVEIRSRPPTKTQLRNMMMTYLKNMGGYKHNQLKGKTYEEIQGLYEREQKFIHDFVLMDSEKEEKKSMEPESEGKKSKRLKRTAGSYAIQKSPKKPKVMKSVKNVTEEEAAKYENEKEELRVDGSSNYHGDMQAFLRRLDRQDLNDLYRSFKKTHLAVLEIVDLFHVPNITMDQLMLRVFPISLTGAASHWLRNEPTSSIKTWEDLKSKFLNQYCPPGRAAEKMEEINNFQQEPDETLYQAWKRFKELLMKCPRHYLTKM
ncbi:hypothetical protein Tco_0971413 [Tanacetum coccineum]